MFLSRDGPAEQIIAGTFGKQPFKEVMPGLEIRFSKFEKIFLY
jgi:hypothetical protein